MKTTMKLTKEQDAIKAHKGKQGNRIIQARAGCLAADTLLQINRDGNGRKYTIEKVALKFNGVQVGKERQWNLSIPTMIARAVDGVVRLGQLKNAWYSGIKMTYEITTESGKSIRATAIHPFLTSKGWRKLKNLTIGCKVAVNVGYERVTSITKYGKEPTFDVEVSDDPHNFLANDFVVHNTGKSSTLRLIAEPEATILCYNRIPADEMQAELTNGAQATTFHSFGKNLFPESGFKYTAARMHWMILDKVFHGNKPTNAEGWELMTLIKTGVNWLKEQAALPTDSPKRIKEILQDVRVDLGLRIDELVEPCMLLLQRSAEKTTWKGKVYQEYDMADMQWLPYVLGLGKGICPYLYIDEGQDINPIRLALLKQWSGGHITIVGDDRQSIYQYQGSMFDCLNKFKVELKAKEYPLTVCWRCPSSHLDLARQIVPDIQNRPNCPEGVINKPELLSDVTIDDQGVLILSRTNAPNIRAYYQFRKTHPDRQVAMNSDISEVLCNLVGSEYDVKVKINAAWHTKYAAKLEKKQKYAKTATSQAVINDHDEAIQAVLSNDNPETVGEFHNILKTNFAKPKYFEKDAIRLSSAHGSKGLQHPHVVIYGTDKFPHPKATEDWERHAESNLLYVAQTRCLANKNPASGVLELIGSNE